MTVGDVVTLRVGGGGLVGGQIRLWFGSLLHIVVTLTVMHQNVEPDVLHYVREPDEQYSFPGEPHTVITFPSLSGGTGSTLESVRVG